MLFNFILFVRNEIHITAMLSTNMTENNPSQIGMATTSATINDENVMTIVPWFHEFSMESHLAQCDQFLSEKVVSILIPKRLIMEVGKKPN